MFVSRHFSWIACVVTVLGLMAMPRSAAAQEADLAEQERELQRIIQAELLDQQARQKQIQEETEFTVHRLDAMMRVVKFYRLDKKAESKAMDEMKATLAKLSKVQMNEVIDRLDKAAAAPDKEEKDKNVLAAYDKHREIVEALRAMLERTGAIRSLEEAAARLEKHAKDILELHLAGRQMINDREELQRPNIEPTRRLFITKRLRNHVVESRQQYDRHKEIAVDVVAVIGRVDALGKKLPKESELLERIRVMHQIERERKVIENLKVAGEKLKNMTTSWNRTELYREGNEKQAQLSRDLQEMARALRTPADRLAALQEASARVEQALQDQKEVNEATKETTAKEEKEADPKKAEAAPEKGVLFPDLTPLAKPKKAARKAALVKAIEDAQAAEKNAEIGKKQAAVEFDTRDAGDLLKEHAKELAKKLEAAGDAMKDSKEKLTSNRPEAAVPPQEKATAALKDVSEALKKEIAALQKEKNDPLAALKNAAKDLDKLIEDQTENRDAAKETVGDKQNLKVPELAKEQKDLAKRTEALAEKPLPNPEKAMPALDKAQAAMKEAAKALEENKSAEAVPKQDKAIDALKEARADVAEQIAAIEKRREEIAKLEEAGKKLEQLAKEENRIADAAMAPKAKDDPAVAKDLAGKQDKVTPQAEEVAKNIEKAAPEAAKTVEEGAKNAEASGKELAKNEPMAGAEKAQEAAQNFKEAQAEIAKALNELKGKEIADE